MSPKKKTPECCTRSQGDLGLNYEEKLSENYITPKDDYSVTILHRLRPRPHRLQRALEIVYKVPVPRTRRRRTRLSVKRCFVQYKRKLRYRGNRNRRTNLARKPTGHFRPSSIVNRTIHPSDTIVASLPRDRNHRKPTSLIRSIKNYIFSAFREGTKWAKKYVWQALRSENKSIKSPASVQRIDERNTISCSSSRVIQPGQSDCKNKTRKRYKTTNNQQRRGEGVSRSSGNDVTSKVSAGNSSGENLGTLILASNLKHRHFNVVANPGVMRSQANDGYGNLVNKACKIRSKSHRKRKKRSRPSKRVASNITRYNQEAREALDYDSSIESNSLALMNSMKPNGDVVVENNTDADLNRIKIDERSSVEIIGFHGTATPGKEQILPSKNDKFSKPSEDDDSFERSFENK